MSGFAFVGVLSSRWYDPELDAFGSARRGEQIEQTRVLVLNPSCPASLF
jgi:hypothetical protein